MAALERSPTLADIQTSLMANGRKLHFVHKTQLLLIVFSNKKVLEKYASN
jgi:hypothetical protein